MNVNEVTEDKKARSRTKIWDWEANKVIETEKITEKDLPGFEFEYYMDMEDYEFTESYWLDVIKEYSHGQIYTHYNSRFSFQVLFSPLRFRLLSMANIPVAWTELEYMMMILEHQNKIHEEVAVILDDAEIMELSRNFKTTCQDPDIMAPIEMYGYYYDNFRAFEEITGMKVTGATTAVDAEGKEPKRNVYPMEVA